MSSPALIDAIRLWTIESNRFDAAFARRAGVAPADVRALDELDVSGGMTPGQLAERLQLTSGSVTALVDRLERQGLVERRPHPSDRRTSILCVTEDAASFGLETYGPFAEELQQAVARVSPAAAEELVTFFAEATEIAARHAERQAELTRAARPAPPAS